MEQMNTIVFGGGCFWCVEEIFRRVRGVSSVIPRYAGGRTDNPTYDRVCTGTTGHAEVVKFDYNTSVISIEELLDIFFAAHDPTTPNRQGADEGTQYRSIILFTDDSQLSSIEQYMTSDAFKRTWPDGVVTEFGRLYNFFPAEDYHRRYYERNSEQPYCRMVIAPKIAKLFRNTKQ